MKIVPLITAQQAQATANYFLSDRLPDRFSADQPRLLETAEAWEIPIILAYPFVGSLGQVGSIIISATSKAILSHTSIEEMKISGQKLYEMHRHAIQAHFS